MAHASYLEHVREMLRTSTTVLQVLAIVAWVLTLLVNPEVERFTPGAGLTLAALIAVCVWKGMTRSVLQWRIGTLCYAVLLGWAFMLELGLMVAQRELFALPLAILLTVGFAGVVPLRRDYLLIALLVWGALLAAGGTMIPPGMNRALVAILIVATVLVGVLLNHAIVINLRRTFTLKEEFRRMAETDALTGIPNRRALMAQLDRACAAKAGLHHFAMLDIDDFKAINDRLGHEAGDAVLVQLADRIGALEAGAFAGRLGGEEFGIVFSGGGHDWARPLLEQVLAEIGVDRPHQAGFGFSAGLVRIERGEQPADVLRRADQALYQAKRAGKRRVVVQPGTPSSGI